MRSPAHDVAVYLDAEGFGNLGSTTEWGIFINNEPSTPDRAITIYDTAASEPAFADLELYSPTIQIRTRARSFEDAYSKQEAIRDKLIIPTTVNLGVANDTRYIGF